MRFAVLHAPEGRRDAGDLPLPDQGGLGPYHLAATVPPERTDGEVLLHREPGAADDPSGLAPAAEYVRYVRSRERVEFGTDPLGTGRLFYTDLGPGFLATNDLHCIASLPGRDPAPDRDMVRFFLRYSFSHPGRTGIADVARLRPGERLVHDTDGLRTEPAPRRSGTEGPPAADYGAALRDGIRAVTEPGDTVALSGGLDSTVLLALMREVHGEVDAVTVDTGANEEDVEAASAVAERYADAHHRTALDADAIDRLPAIMREAGTDISPAGPVLMYDRIIAAAPDGERIVFGVGPNYTLHNPYRDTVRRLRRATARLPGPVRRAPCRLSGIHPKMQELCRITAPDTLPGHVAARLAPYLSGAEAGDAIRDADDHPYERYISRNDPRSESFARRYRSLMRIAHLPNFQGTNFRPRSRDVAFPYLAPAVDRYVMRPDSGVLHRDRSEVLAAAADVPGGVVERTPRRMISPDQPAGQHRAMFEELTEAFMDRPFVDGRAVGRTLERSSMKRENILFTLIAGGEAWCRAYLDGDA